MSGVETTSLATFAAQLKSWRQQAGWTQVQLAEKLGYSGSYVSAVETAGNGPSTGKVPSVDFAEQCDKVFRTPGYDDEAEPPTPGLFMQLHQLISREAYPSWFQPAVEFERDAVRIYGWELGAIPGLFQTEEYARALIRSGRLGDNAEKIDRLVTGRMERQVILARENPPMVWFVIDEAALRRVIGGVEVMADQLDQLLIVSEMPGTVIQVLKSTADNHAGTDGPILVFEWPGKPTVCYTECYAGGRVVEAQDEVSNLVTVMNLIRASASSVSESKDLIRAIRRGITSG